MNPPEATPEIPTRFASREEVARELEAARSGLFAYLLAAVRNYHDAEDLLQEVSLVALVDAGSFTPGTNFRAWSREIARRRVLAFARRRDGRPVSVDPLMLEALTDAAAEVDAEESVEMRQAMLTGCLSKLRDEMREVLEYKYWSRLSAEQTAVSAEPCRRCMRFSNAPAFFSANALRNAPNKKTSNRISQK